jgi:hypothetical protein
MEPSRRTRGCKRTWSALTVVLAAILRPQPTMALVPAQRHWVSLQGSGLRAPHDAAPSTAGANVTVVPVDEAALAVAGDVGSTEGIFDPSLAAGDTTGGGEGLPPLWMSYSTVTATNDIHSRVAAWDAAADEWTFVADVNAAVMNASVSCPAQPGGVCNGSIVHEVSSLVYDASDPDAGRRLKLFTHSYLVAIDGTLHYDIGYITLWTAPAAEGPWSGVPWLGWQSASPFSSEGVQQVLSDFAELADCAAFTEPGAVWVAPPVPAAGGGPAAFARTPNGPAPPVLALALGCVYYDVGLQAVAIRVVLLQSASSAANFTFVATLLTGEDALALNYSVPQLNAADLMWANGQMLLSVSPSTQLAPEFIGYIGCLVFGLNSTWGVPRDAVTGAPLP